MCINETSVSYISYAKQSESGRCFIVIAMIYTM